MSDLGIENIIEDAVNEYREKVKEAVKYAEVVARTKIEQDILPEIIGQYYYEYNPKYYKRQWQLYKSLGPYTLYKSSNNVFSLKIGIEDESPYGPEAMFHTKRNGNEVNINSKVDNGEIFKNFLKGTHPNAPKRGEEWTGTNTVQYADSLLEDLIENELIPLIDGSI